MRYIRVLIARFIQILPVRQKLFTRFVSLLFFFFDIFELIDERPYHPYFTVLINCHKGVVKHLQVNAASVTCNQNFTFIYLVARFECTHSPVL